jgi:hypothetical protein
LRTAGDTRSLGGKLHHTMTEHIASKCNREQTANAADNRRSLLTNHEEIPAHETIARRET